MLGRNPIAAARALHDLFHVHSLFYTIQGEGPFAGTPAIFLRMAGCNLRCFWCDTDFEQGDEYEPDRLVIAIREQVEKHRCHFIVITGGEPLLQPLRHLIDAPELNDCRFQIETAGSFWPYGGLSQMPYNVAGQGSGLLSVVVSPKTPRVVPYLRHTGLHDVYWKYIVSINDILDKDDGLPLSSTQIRGQSSRLFRPTDTDRFLKFRIFVQPRDDNDPEINKLNTALAVSLAKDYGYRLSMQQHKILGLP